MSRTNREYQDSEESDRVTAIVRTAFARFDIRALVLTSGISIAVVLMALTTVVLLTPPAPGREVGEHLVLLANYFPGYAVSWPGVLVGGAYGFATGGILGGFFGMTWNLMHVVYLMVAVLRRGASVEL